MDKQASPSSYSKLTRFTQKAIDVFKGYAGIPSLARACILPHSASGISTSGNHCLEVEATWIQTEMERGKKVAFSKSYFVKKSGYILEKICSSAFQSDATQM